ncbi:hypothetical protein WA026_009216 [Henosepilachna vigintioctopunctata]|uniref:Uncharacterized protein n=1 Tax=Henosepilachna vigintioctopunctata TaxID=420089 RepID=A0AAW1UV67_9CUCU
MSQTYHCNWLLLLVLFSFHIFQVKCVKSEVISTKGRNGTYISLPRREDNTGVVQKFTKELANIFTEARKGGGGGGGLGGDGGMGAAIMKSIMSMCSTTIPMVTMTVMGWMKDIMLMGAGAFMMMMYDMLKKSGDQKKIIIKLPPQAAPPPEPAPPTNTGYGPWEGR